jgi:hypothetical protein
VWVVNCHRWNRAGHHRACMVSAFTWHFQPRPPDPAVIKRRYPALALHPPLRVSIASRIIAAQFCYWRCERAGALYMFCCLIERSGLRVCCTATAMTTQRTRSRPLHAFLETSANRPLFIRCVRLLLPVVVSSLALTVFAITVAALVGVTVADLLQ